MVDPFAVIYTRNFGHVAGMAHSLAPSALAAPDPCESDTNLDGRADWNDVAYACQIILSGRPPSPLERREMMRAKPECEEDFCRA